MTTAAIRNPGTCCKSWMSIQQKKHLAMYELRREGRDEAKVEAMAEKWVLHEFETMDISLVDMLLAENKKLKEDYACLELGESQGDLNDKIKKFVFFCTL